MKQNKLSLITIKKPHVVGNEKGWLSDAIPAKYIKELYNIRLALPGDVPRVYAALEARLTSKKMNGDK